MRKGLMASLALTLVLGFVGYTLAQQAPPQRQMGPQGPMGPGPGMGGPMGPGKQGQMGPGMGMGPGMMGQMGGQGMMGMGPGMGMMGPMMNSPEIMGTMMSIHGEIQTLMGQMMQKHGRAMETPTPELEQQMRKEMMERMGDILTRQGAALKERAKAAGK